MRDPNSAIPEEAQPAVWRRYDDWRAQRHLEFTRKNADKMRSWRNRRGARRLVRFQALAMMTVLAAAVLSYVTPWFAIPFTAGVLGMLWINRSLRIVTGSTADSPAAALDELQLAQRNSARSIGFFVTYSLMFIPYAVLVVLSLTDTATPETAYGTAILLISLLLVAITVPNALTAWWFTDPDPEDLDPYPAQFGAQFNDHHGAPYTAQFDDQTNDRGGYR